MAKAATDEGGDVAGVAEDKAFSTEEEAHSYGS
jgi:hypothetical protein